jgi:hypothetical protein
VPSERIVEFVTRDESAGFYLLRRQQIMTPASRTPEGELNQCPICGKEVRLEPSRPPGDAPCPNCGHLLWFPSLRTSATDSVKLSESTFRTWTDLIAELPDDRYCGELVSGLVTFLAAKSGAVWIISGTRLRLKSQQQDADLPETPTDRGRADRLLQQVAATGLSRFSHPGREPQFEEGNPEAGSSLLLTVPVKRKRKTVAIIEIAQEPGATIELQQDNMRFLERIGSLIGDRIGALVDGDYLLDTIPVSDARLAVPGRKKRWWEIWKH